MSKEQYFVSRVETMPLEPKACAGCGKVNLAENIVHDDIGKGNTYLCLESDCETLNIVTKFSRDKIALRAAKGKKVTLRHNAGN